MAGSNPPSHALHTRVTHVDAAAIAAAAQAIIAGQCVAIPTETVYGLAADACNAQAVAGIYAAKGRPDFNPLIVHVDSFAAAQALGIFDDHSRHLAETFWPGPLTIVVPRSADCPVATIATAGLDTIALRCPAHPAMRALIAASGRPLAAPSANASGAVSPTTAAHVLATLAGRIPLIVDAGPCVQGLESTIVRVIDGNAVILRPGPVTADQIACKLLLPIIADTSGAISAPGQLASHYAPGKPVELDCPAPIDGAFHIGFGPGPADYALSRRGDLVQAAAHLFDALHAGAQSPAARITVAPIPEHGIGAAINDRLRRAAA